MTASWMATAAIVEALFLILYPEWRDRKGAPTTMRERIRWIIENPFRFLLWTLVVLIAIGTLLTSLGLVGNSST
jgi:hypothetical protein